MSVAVTARSVTATLLIFADERFVLMVTIVSVILIAAALSFAVFQVIRNARKRCGEDIKVKRTLRLLCISIIVWSLGMLCAGECPFRLLAETQMSMMAIYMMSFSLRPDAGRSRYRLVFPGLLLIMAIYYILCLSGALRMFPSSVFMAMADVCTMLAAGMTCWLIWRRIHEVKSVLVSGNIMSFLNLCVDFFYLLAPFAVLLFMHALSAIFPASSGIFALLAVVLVFMEMMAICMRMSFDSMFAFLYDHERIIFESMKMSHVETVANPENKRENQYRELFGRISHYFETSRPYLDGNLTINDVVKMVYSNKVYISKAICHFTGRNFRQYVNYHRVMYSLDLFRENLELKVADLSEQSGFNNMVSYTMAFRLFLNETPSEWCRKERSKILKPKK